MTTETIPVKFYEFVERPMELNLPIYRRTVCIEDPDSKTASYQRFWRTTKRYTIRVELVSKGGIIQSAEIECDPSDFEFFGDDLDELFGKGDFACTKGMFDAAYDTAIKFITGWATSDE